MDNVVKLKQIMLLIGDIVIFYFALTATLFLRYATDRYKHGFEEFFSTHFWPFTLVLFLWILIAYIGGLYDLRSLKNNPDFTKKFFALVAINGALAILLFYLLPLVITPRTNLFIFLVIFGLSQYIWRGFYNTLLSSGKPINRILLIGYNQAAEALANHIEKNPQLGYEIKFWMKEGLQDKEFEHLSQIILANDVNLIVVPAHIKKNAKAAKLIYHQLILDIEVLDLAGLYERIFLKVPIAELEEVWFLENLAKNHSIYDFFKRPMEALISLLLIILFLPFGIIISLLTALTSKGPIILRQTRVGKAGQIFTLYKFRSMVANAEKHGPEWSTPQDKRSTPFGSLLRRTHLDEIPQLINVIKGDLSLIGPRPERPEFVKNLKQGIAFYELRHLARPGITGWAQIHYRYGASVEDAYEKLQYEIYYLKNRSLVLDLIIAIKTLRLFFVSLK